jgi:hypothetical protein
MNSHFCVLAYAVFVIHLAFLRYSVAKTQKSAKALRYAALSKCGQKQRLF